MKKIRFYFKLFLAFISRFKLLILISIAVGVVLFLFINLVATKFLIRKTDKIGVSGRYDADSLPDFILEDISDGLTSVNDTKISDPSLAASWETPDKGKTWIFTLKDDIYWQDGEKLSSTDIDYDFSDVTVERPDERTISFSLKDPFIPFPYVVSKPIFKKGLLGTGRWRVEDISLVGGNISTLVLKNENKDKKIYKFYPTTDRTLLAFKRGEVDSLAKMSDVSSFSNWENIVMDGVNDSDQVVTIFLNTKDPNLSDKTLRQALNYAIDKESFGNIRATSPVSPDSWGYNPSVKTYDYDKERAIELIDEVFGNIDTLPELKLVSTPTLLEVAEQIANFWEDAGIKTTVQVSSVIPTEYQAFLAIFDMPDDPDQYSFWHSTQTQSNITGYASPRIDKLLEDGRSELDLAKRKKVYLDFQRFLVEDSPALFLYHPQYYNISRK